MKEKLKIEAGKFYRTRDGRKAGIYRTDVNHPEYSIHGYVEFDSVEYPLVWRSDGRYFDTGEHCTDLISEWHESLGFDWDCLPPWCNKCIAMNEDGAWNAYSNEPTPRPWGSYNVYATIIAIPREYQPKNFTGDWTDSLFKNPNLD